MELMEQPILNHNNIDFFNLELVRNVRCLDQLIIIFKISKLIKRLKVS